MTIQDFRGRAKPLDEYDVPQLAHRINVSEDHLQAFLNVESRDTAFDDEGRPIILNEPHVFYRNLSGAQLDQAIRLGLAYKSWGEKPYPKTMDARYQWLHEAMQINCEAALKSCSWGSSQILGENYSLIGYKSAESMVRAFMDDEENHVEGMVKYILATGIDDDMRAGRWETVARVYNGPGYKKHGYHLKLSKEYQRLVGIPDSDWTPDGPDPVRLTYHDKATIKSVQARLKELGYTEVGKVDGVWGTRTRAALLGFRADAGLPLVADIDDDLLAALMRSEERPVAPERANTTVADVRDSGSRQIDAADKTQAGGLLVGAGGVLAMLGEAIGDPTELPGKFVALHQAIEPVIEIVEGMSPYAAVALAGFIFWQQLRSKQARVEDERAGRHVGRG